MNYQAFARKWRPKTFLDVIGHDYVIKIITKSFLLKKVHHAYLLAGTRGIGKTTIARLFAKGLNCEKSSETSIICQTCKICKMFENETFVDLIEIDAASRTKVEDIREFLDNVQYSPSVGRFKIYLIDEVHMLSRHSFNALLKTLEEPPSHVKFILVTTEYKKLPATILSRCLQFYLKPLTTSQIVANLTNILRKENIKLNVSALTLLANLAKGSMRDAINFLEQIIFLEENEININSVKKIFSIPDIEQPFLFVENLINNNVNNLMRQIEFCSSLEINWDLFLIEILSIFQKIAVSQFSLNHTGNDIYESESFKRRLNILKSKITSKNLQLCYKIFLLGRKELPFAPNNRIGIEMITLRALTVCSSEKLNINSKNNIENNIFLEKNNFYKNLKNFTNKNYKEEISINNNLKKSLVYKNKNINDILYLNNKKLQSINNESKLKDLEHTHDFKSKFDITSKLLKARLSLLQYKKDNWNDKSFLNTLLKSKNFSKKNTLKQVLETNKNVINKYSLNNLKLIENKKYKNLIEKDNINPVSIKSKKYSNLEKYKNEVIKEAINNNDWICQIYKLSLPKLAKKILMNSWKKEDSENNIFLYLRSNYYHLNSIDLKNVLQKALENSLNKSIKLYIQEDKTNSMKTPVEYICELYKDKIKKIKNEILEDVYFKKIKKFFDIKLNDDNLKIL